MWDSAGITVSRTCAITVSISESCALIDVDRANTPYPLQTTATTRTGPHQMTSRCSPLSLMASHQGLDDMTWLGSRAPQAKVSSKLAGGVQQRGEGAGGSTGQDGGGVGGGRLPVVIELDARQLQRPFW